MDLTPQSLSSILSLSNIVTRIFTHITQKSIVCLVGSCFKDCFCLSGRGVGVTWSAEVGSWAHHLTRAKGMRPLWISNGILGICVLAQITTQNTRFLHNGNAICVLYNFGRCLKFCWTIYQGCSCCDYDVSSCFNNAWKNTFRTHFVISLNQCLQTYIVLDSNCSRF